MKLHLLIIITVWAYREREFLNAIDDARKQFRYSQHFLPFTSLLLAISAASTTHLPVYSPPFPVPFY